jgi:D-aminoacyl-tRNA deacylase
VPAEQATPLTMRAVLQRVTSASVTVDGAPVGSIGRGLLVLLGVCAADGPDDIAYVVNRVLAARLWEDPADGRPWTGSAASLGLPLLVVSQFTLYASTRKPKPDFHRAAPAAAARGLYDDAVAEFRARHPGGPGSVATGVFQAMMAVSLVNDGPVTVIVDSLNRDDELPGWPAEKQSKVKGAGSTPASSPTASAGGGDTPAAAAAAAVTEAAAAVDGGAASTTA